MLLLSTGTGTKSIAPEGAPTDRREPPAGAIPYNAGCFEVARGRSSKG